jgi:dTDP-glucose 4,6-dehydratase
MGADWSKVTPVEDRKGHDRRYSVDDSKLRALGYEPQHKFVDGLAETVAWYKDNEAWWRPLQAKAVIK